MHTDTDTQSPGTQSETYQGPGLPRWSTLTAVQLFLSGLQSLPPSSSGGEAVWIHIKAWIFR